MKSSVLDSNYSCDVTNLSYQDTNLVLDKIENNINNFSESEICTKGTPLLKWPGGKRNLLKHIFSLIPRNFGNYYEPFVGGGALFFALQPQNATLSDSNLDLINCYIQVRDNPEEVILKLKSLNNSEQDYYNIRSNVPTDEIEKAVRLIYLTTLSFNGIYRQNLKGEFNVPYGQKIHLQPCDEIKIRAVSQALKTTNLHCMDFETSVANADKGDLIYFDPPYTIAKGKNGFIKYNSKIFSWDDQIRLSKLASELSNKGCKVIVSNANHPSIMELYKGFKFNIIERNSIIAASGQFRRQITESIFYNEV
ncbi:Dam family site-specific DNA-(adenine-N6)-methyltransferase [Brevibacillus halotolerans]|uniref:DNA adenine methylase n=1 Tax=Brevibacillus laterosporus TaxID=1465 RepID=UPI00215B99CC|nr:Dam family site-specific DNA-(adenine-N6)-methyltransferase [Brevibacillus laterosporus]MCR8996190.1 Dam family site-specific DNA-(adenine-N6)-methyltransferase [Brevibacillus laterosporus]WPS87803.1 Dam family site-specific DNA-(adenine-N6)-methyltransferase [Brevibacillus halotolerans]